MLSAGATLTMPNKNISVYINFDFGGWGGVLHSCCFNILYRMNRLKSCTTVHKMTEEAAGKVSQPRKADFVFPCGFKCKWQREYLMRKQICNSKQNQ